MQPDKVVYEVRHETCVDPRAEREWSGADGLYETAEAAQKAVVDLLDRSHRERFGRSRDAICSVTCGPRYEREISPLSWSPPPFTVRKVMVAS